MTGTRLPKLSCLGPPLRELFDCFFLRSEGANILGLQAVAELEHVVRLTFWGRS